MNSLVNSFGSMGMVTPVTPLPHQIEWFNTIVTRFRNGELVVLDTSKMGLGKTYGPLFAAQTFRLPLFVVGPASSVSTWDTACNTHGIQKVAYYSYQGLAGTETKGTSCIYLTRQDERACEKSNGASGARTTVYEPTQELINLLHRGVIFVFDEIQDITSGGGNTYHKAILAIMNTLRTYPNAARAFFLSATPIKSEKEILTFLPLLGCLTPGLAMLGPAKREKIKLSFRERMLDHGLGEMYTFCKKYEPDLTEEIIDAAYDDKTPKKGKSAANAALAKRVAIDLYAKVIGKHVGGYMKKMESEEFKCYFYNLYTPLSSTSYAAITRAINDFEKEVYYNPVSGLIERPPGKGFGGDIAALQAIHSCLIESLYFQVMRQFREKPNSKALIFTYFLQNIEELEYLFTGLFPVAVIDGSSKPAERQRIADSFRFPGGPRVLICNGKTGSVGLSMHSVTPGLEIHAYSLPFWNIIICHQQTGRIYRADKNGVVNNAYFNIHYPPRKPAKRIQRINRALSECAGVMSRAIGGIEESTLPGNYPEKEVLPVTFEERVLPDNSAEETL